MESITDLSVRNVLILPAQADLAGTPYEKARKAPEKLVDTLDGVLVDQPDEGVAHALLLLRPIPADELTHVLATNPDISWVQLPFAGVEKYLDLMRAHDHITFTSAKGTYAPPVAEHALALTLALLRHFPERVLATSWGGTKGTTLNGSRVVIVGGGGIGTELVRLFNTWDTHITVVRRQAHAVPGADRTVTTDQLDEVLPEADVVIVAAAATPDTYQMFSTPQFRLMRRKSVLVNIARGSLIDTEALVDALANDLIQAAGLDVTDPEPLPDGHPLWSQPRCLITPHTADTPEMCIPLLNDRFDRNLRLLANGGSTSDLEGQVDIAAGY